MLVLILLIVTVIGFIVDSKNKDKVKKENVTLNDLSDDLSLTKDSSNNEVIDSVSNSSNLNQTVTNFNQLHNDAITNANETVSSFNNQSIQQNVPVEFDNLNNNINNNLNDSSVNETTNLVINVNQVSELNNQMYNGQVMSSGANYSNLNNVSSLGGGTVNVDESFLIKPQVSVQPQENIISQGDVNSSVSMQSQVSVQPQENIPSRHFMQTQIDVNQLSANNGYIRENVNSMPVDNGAIFNANNLQYDMSNPMSLDNVNASQGFNVSNGYNSQYQGYTVSQIPQVVNTNYNNGYNYMANNPNTYQTGQVINNNFSGMNSYQSNMVNGMMMSSLNPSAQPNVRVNNNEVVTTDGAKPFDINSMFINNQ